MKIYKYNCQQCGKTTKIANDGRKIEICPLCSGWAIKRDGYENFNKKVIKY